MAIYNMTQTPFRTVYELLNGLASLSMIQATIDEESGEMLVAVEYPEVESFMGLLFSANTNPRAISLSVQDEPGPAWPDRKTLLVTWHRRPGYDTATLNAFYSTVIDCLTQKYFKQAA